MIDNNNQLNTQQLKDLEQLLAECRKTDNSVPNVYFHIIEQPRALPANFLFYSKEKLIGFLSVYFFYEDAVEIALAVDPSSRKKGVARKLIDSVLPMIESQNYHHLIFSSPSHLNDQWLLAKNFIYDHSEYFMERRDLNPLLTTNKELTFRKATHSDIPVLKGLDEACFPERHGNLVERFEYLLEEREYLILLALQNNHPIGKAHIRWQPSGATLSDIAILPAQQGRGYGTGLITHCINLALVEGKPNINLDVETHNLKALNLYTQLGFLIQNACDYWTININQLHKE